VLTKKANEIENIEVLCQHAYGYKMYRYSLSVKSIGTNPERRCVSGFFEGESGGSFI